MAILIDENTKAIVQGITGHEGRKAASYMQSYHTKVVAGVTPGKGGQDVEGVPVYNTVAEAVAEYKANASVIMVPPMSAKSAVMEALASGIKLVVCVTEDVPLHDTAAMIQAARIHNAVLIGPGSVGVLSTSLGRMGMLGGPDELVQRVYAPGNIGIISKSGGMTNETAWVIRQAGLGQSTVVGMGGELLVGNTYADILQLFEHDKATKAVALFGEVGGTYEQEAAQVMTQGDFTKPLAVFIGGKFASRLPAGVRFGHAGAIINRGLGGVQDKIKVLRQAGAIIAEQHHQLGQLLRDAL